MNLLLNQYWKPDSGSGQVSAALTVSWSVSPLDSELDNILGQLGTVSLTGTLGEQFVLTEEIHGNERFEDNTSNVQIIVSITLQYSFECPLLYIVQTTIYTDTKPHRNNYLHFIIKLPISLNLKRRKEN